MAYRLGRKKQREKGSVGEGAGNGERAVGARPRPLLVKMENEKMKWDIIKNAKKVKDVQIEKFRNISIVPDKTQRKRRIQKS